MSSSDVTPNSFTSCAYQMIKYPKASLPMVVHILGRHPDMLPAFVRLMGISAAAIPASKTRAALCCTAAVQVDVAYLFERA